MNDTIKDIDSAFPKEEQAALKAFFIMCKHLGFNGVICSLNDYIKDDPAVNK